jgi:hypothetical protein
VTDDDPPTLVDGRPLLSLDETERLCSDHHYPSTADYLVQLGADEDHPCFTLEQVPVGGIDPGQLLDDPDASESQAKVAAIQSGIRDGDRLPPVYLLHRPDVTPPLFLFEGMHRFTASHREQVGVLAWVAHLGCCGSAPVASR